MAGAGDPGGGLLERTPQQSADDRAAVRVETRRAVGLDDRQRAAEPSGVGAAAGKAPTRGHAVAALDDPRLAGPGTPGEDAAGPAEDLACRCGFEVSRGH